MVGFTLFWHCRIGLSQLLSSRWQILWGPSKERERRTGSVNSCRGGKNLSFRVGPRDCWKLGDEWWIGLHRPGRRSRIITGCLKTFDTKLAVSKMQSASLLFFRQPVAYSYPFFSCYALPFCLVQ